MIDLSLWYIFSRCQLKAIHTKMDRACYVADSDNHISTIDTQSGKLRKQYYARFYCT